MSVPTPSRAVRRPRRALRELSLGRYTGVLVGLAVVCGYLAVTEPAFLTLGNWENIVRASAVVALLAVGMTFVVLTGGIDLSVASIAAASSMLLGLAIQWGWHWIAALLVGVGVAFGIGLLNGLLIGIARIPFFVVTLGTLSIYQSFALLTTNGTTLSLFGNPSFRPIQDFVNGSVGPFPTLLIAVAAISVVAALILNSTAFGRAVYAVGSNRDAAELTGINVTLVLVTVYAVSGLSAGLGAVALTGRLTAASPQIDPNLMLTVIAAVLIGGTAFTGGDGGVLGTVIGVLFLAAVQNGLALAGVSASWQGTVSGLILILAVAFGVLRAHGIRPGGLRRLRATSAHTTGEIA